ncbi:hypothetical protein DFH94DRAFT_326553 [Russula ochroleuca]|uniref:Uncharacterized protein n=1 Tax=Russula ochroleuca TaxID=152965 RepID=A0A9P5N1C8_9AGAM|nr:hypothetical protein DFH94DRAFT_326553 [Russula ochroleuca]
MSSSSVSPSSTATDSSSSSPTPTTSGGGTPATATLLFGFLVIFAALFAAFLFLALFWKFQRRRLVALPLEIGEIGGTHRGVPKLWEAWIRDEPSENQWKWESISPLSIDVDRELSEEAIGSTSRSRRPWPFCLFRRKPVPPPSDAQQQQQPDPHTDADAEAISTGLISGVRASFVIAMPHADAPEQWRRSEISRVSQVVEQHNWRRKEYAIGIYHPSFREGWSL